MGRPQKPLKNNPYESPTFFYPNNLGNEGQEPYIIFQIRDAVARGAKSLGTVALYMPPTVKVNYNAQYEEVDLSVSAGKTAISDAAFAGVNTATNGIEAGIGSAGNALSNGAQVLSTLTGINSAAKELEASSGKIVNPHASLLFRGVGFRRFKFDFHMMARNQQESTSIRNIIYTFKYHMHPAASTQGGEAGSSFLYYPENFIIGLFSPEDDFLFKIGTCALESVDVDYAGSGVPSFFSKTGAPVDIRMSLSFRELELVTKERVEEGL